MSHEMNSLEKFLEDKEAKDAAAKLSKVNARIERKIRAVCSHDNCPDEDRHVKDGLALYHKAERKLTDSIGMYPIWEAFIPDCIINKIVEVQIPAVIEKMHKEQIATDAICREKLGGLCDEYKCDPETKRRHIEEGLDFYRKEDYTLQREPVDKKVFRIARQMHEDLAQQAAAPKEQTLTGASLKQAH